VERLEGLGGLRGVRKISEGKNKRVAKKSKTPYFLPKDEKYRRRDCDTVSL
jgi:hypothetical protein